MRTMKITLGLIAAAIPLLWAGGLLLHLNNVRTAFGGYLDREMAPTMLGLGVIVLLLLIPFVLRIRKLTAGPRAPGTPGAGSGGGGGGPVDPAPQEEPKSDFDPDAALARYMARRAAGGAGGQTGFGRKGA